MSILLISTPAVFASAGAKDVKMGNTVTSVNTATSTKGMKESDESSRSYTGGGSDDPSNYDTSEEASTIPQWDIVWGLGASFGSVDNDFNVAGVTFEAQLTRMWLFANFSKDDMFLRTRLTHQHMEGENTFNYLDADYLGLTLQPGYRLLDQETQLIDLEVYGLVEFGYNNYDPGVSQWRLSPGFGFDISRNLAMGKLTAGYTYLNSRNIDGDDEITDSSYVNIHSTYLSWDVALTEKVIAGASMQYTMADNLPAGMENDWLTLGGQIKAMIADNVDFVIGYEESISGGNGRTVTLGLNFSW
jgi:hypothetical protein